MALNDISPYVIKVINGFLNAQKTLKNNKLNDYSIPDVDKDFVHEIEELIASSLLLGRIHAAEEEPGFKAADTDIPPIPFKEAVQFLKTKVPMKKKEWAELEQKLRFRAFTVARLGSVDLIEKAKNVLVKSLENGGDYASTWESLRNKVSPGYWENVFRTNTQSAYVAGKLQQYSKSDVVAYQLMVIDDSRTTDICRGLLNKFGYGAILPVDHEFWKTHGFPPYHFQCRTSIRGIWKSQTNPKYYNVYRKGEKTVAGFKPMEGFGGNPIELESWWMMTEDMAIRAAEMGIFNDIEDYAKNMGLYNFSLSLVSGSDVKKLDGIPYKAKKAVLAEPKQKELLIGKKLEEEGHSVYFIPENKLQEKIINPDAIVDGKMTEFKTIESLKIDKIVDNLKKQNAKMAKQACLMLPDKPNYSIEEAIEYVSNYLKKADDTNLQEVILIYKGKCYFVK